ncbi:DUF6668 family protein [Streptomyces sp. LN704]|uniref:DUF6668 family protein n=1 Tax=unclassified Streptomyces TaxID=2593676 RepID=UPI00371B350B
MGIAQQGPDGPEIWIRGPVGEAAPPRAEHGQVPAGARRFAWVATHGGAGTSTLATVFGGLDAGRGWPPSERDEPWSVFLVGRTHAAGLEAVSYTLDIFRRREAPPGLDLEAVVLVADAPGRLPRPLAQRVKALTSVIDVHQVPWVPAWRLGDLGAVPPRESAALARLTASAKRL